MGTACTQTEFEAVGLHVFNNQAIGDLLYASSTTQLSRLGIGANGDFLTLTAGIPAWTSNKTTTLYIGDTANATMTLGLTLNQGSAIDEIMAVKSSTVAHGMTDIAETDTYGDLKLHSTTLGGFQIRGFGENTVSLSFQALGTVDNITKTTAGAGYIQLAAYKKSVATVGAPGADANLMTILAVTTTRFIFDNEGSGHADVEWIAFQGYDDLGLITDIEQELLLRENKAQTSRRKALEVVGIIGKDSWHMENGKPRAMVNFTKLAMLHHGALLQTYDRLQVLEQKHLELENKISSILSI